MNLITKNITLYLLILFINIVIVHGQNKETFSDAMSKFESEDYVNAFALFQKILKNEPDNCHFNYLAGMCLFNQPYKKKEAILYFENAVKSVSKSYKEEHYKETNAPIEALFNYAITLQINNRLAEAKEFYLKYQSQLNKKDIDLRNYIDQKIKSCDIAEEMQKMPIHYKSQLLAEPIKSKKTECKAVFNADETKMVFESDRSGKPGIFYSEYIKEKWSNPAEITRDLDIDLKYDKFSLCSMSANGKRLYILITDDYESALYVSTFEKRKWVKTKLLNKNINGIFTQTFASESPDGKQLYFTSNRNGGFGNLDIYVSSLTEKDEWGPAKNLGESINTPFNEETPFVGHDNNTLYFSSEGHNSMGGYDIFVSKRISKSEWGKPENIGYPINTTEDNLFFVPSKEDNKGYCVLNPDQVPHISLIDLNKVEEPVEAPKPKEELAAVLVIKPATDSLPKPEIIPVVKPKENIENKLFNLTGKISFSDKTLNYNNTLVKIKSTTGKFIDKQKISADGNYQSKLKTGSYLLEFTNPGYKSIVKPVIISNENINDIIVDALLDPEVIVKETKKIKERIIPVSSEINCTNQYTIQIAAFVKRVPLSTFNNIQDVEYNIGTDGLVRYYQGHFNSKSEAYSELATIVDKGYKDAFIVPFSKYSTDIKCKILTGYTVQVFASFYEIDTNKFGQLRDIRMFKSNDRYFRYTSGIFEEYSDACKYLLEVEAKGFSDAFIRRFDSVAKK